MLELRPETTNIIGYIASTVTTAAFVPQVVRTWRTKSVEDLSVAMLVTFIVGIVMWLVYGVAIQSAPVVLGNAVTLVLNAMLLLMRLHYGRQR